MGNVLRIFPRYRGESNKAGKVIFDNKQIAMCDAVDICAFVLTVVDEISLPTVSKPMTADRTEGAAVLVHLVILLRTMGTGFNVRSALLKRDVSVRFFGKTVIVVGLCVA